MLAYNAAAQKFYGRFAYLNIWLGSSDPKRAHLEPQPQKPAPDPSAPPKQTLFDFM